MLALEELQQDEELVLEVAQLEEGRGVVAVFLLGAVAFFLVAGADGVFFVLDGFVGGGFVFEAFDAEGLEGGCEFLGLSCVSFTSNEEA